MASHEISSLAVADCPVLGTLDCYLNRITELDLRKTALLKKLVETVEMEEGIAVFGDAEYVTDLWIGEIDGTKRFLTVDPEVKVVTDETEPEPEPEPELPSTFSDKTGSYRIEPDGTAAFTRPAKSAATVSVPASITVNGQTLKVTAIADKAFQKDKKLTTVTIGKNVKTIGKNAFAGCAKLKTVKGGAGAVSIGDGAFSGCKVLKTFPALSRLQTIGANAFKGCVKLTGFTLGAAVKSIGKNAFSGCKALKTVTVKTAKLKDSSVKAGAFKGIHSKAVFKCPKKQLKAYKKLFVKKGAPKTCRFN